MQLDYRPANVAEVDIFRQYIPFDCVESIPVRHDGKFAHCYANCLFYVNAKVGATGVTGWSLWSNFKGLWLNAERHCVLADRQGRKCDITASDSRPKAMAEIPRITFAWDSAACGLTDYLTDRLADEQTDYLIQLWDIPQVTKIMHRIADTPRTLDTQLIAATHEGTIKLADLALQKRMQKKYRNAKCEIVYRC